MTKQRSLPTLGPISFLIKVRLWNGSHSIVICPADIPEFDLRGDGDLNHIAEVCSEEAHDFTCTRIINPTTRALRGLDPL
ncbi:hypothetical protein PMN64_06850 [Bradyrhizobium sp. UFLA01-814]|uniref:hypothetical protein n=1 Tax=Bradyrhizobium sp. UFLA01-814 TaxID=3023480 RepID=UPI00398B85C7